MDVHYDDEVLAHFGVRGMRWGVRKAKKVVKAQRNTRNAALTKKINAEENRGHRAYDKAFASARRAGKRRMAAHREGVTAMKKSDAKVSKLEEGYGKIQSDYKKKRAGIREDAKATRKQVGHIETAKRLGAAKYTLRVLSGTMASVRNSERRKEFEKRQNIRNRRKA